MTSHVKKQLFIIISSLGISFLLVYFLADTIPAIDVSENNETTDQAIEYTAETSQTGIEGTVISNNGSDQLQVRLELRDGVRDVTISVASDTPLFKRSFSNGEVIDTKTSLSEVSVGDEVSVVVLTGALNLSDQTTIIPIELIFRGG